jgi:periplasmic divalent cation tolerance protein
LLTDYLSVTTTVDTREAAEGIAQVVLEARLAACVQIEGPLTSAYRWQGAIERTQEWRCTIKTRAELFAGLETALRDVHPYATPEILAQPIAAGAADYLAWIDASVRPATA